MADNEKKVLIDVDNAGKTYQMGEVEVQALRNANLKIYEGEYLLIAGPSGSGKSTLLNIIGGMDKPSSGIVKFKGQEISTASDRKLNEYRRTQVGFVFQFFNLIPSLTAIENLQVAKELAKNPMDLLETLDIVGLRDRANHFPSQMSGGEQQRIAIARAIVGNPSLILCDEPTGALDTQNSIGVLQILFDLNRKLGKTVIVISHDELVREIASRIINLRDGSVESIENNSAPIEPSSIVLDKK